MTRFRRPLALLTLLLALFVLPAASESGADDVALSAGQAVVLGVVEGVTEFLPISSTGHLLVTQNLMDVGTTEETEAAADSYAIVIQAGAILAVLVLYHERIRSMLLGVIGRDEVGRRITIAVVVSFVPAAVVGLLAEDAIKERLFGLYPIAAAWMVGGAIVLWVSRTFLDREAEEAEAVDPTPDDEFDPADSRETDRGGLATITVQQALIIGVAQCLAMWPGTSRSLVTIVAAVLVGLTLPAAVEYSFLLGLATLGAATVYESAKSGGEIVDTFGLAAPVIGFVAAFVSAVVAIRWMVGYLQRHSFAIFGWYRIAVGALVLVLAAAGVLEA